MFRPSNTLFIARPRNPGYLELTAQVIRPAVGQIDVIAVRVEFLTDTTELTSGTGILAPMASVVWIT